MTLTKPELLRYNRQMLMPEIGEAGQLRLKKSSVLIVGAGGLGSPVSLYLAAAGVGRLGIVDNDRVDISNLQRQILYKNSEQGKPKALVAGEKLKELNPEIQIEVFNETLSAANAIHLFANWDVIADGTDNFATRFLINDAAYFSKKVLVSASVLSFEGQLGTFLNAGGPCYRCVYPEPPPAGTVPSCAEAGVLGSAVGVMGSLQATEILKYLLGLSKNSSEGSSTHLFAIDLLEMNFTKLGIKKNPDCPLCGSTPKIHNLREENFVCAADARTAQSEISPVDLKEWLKTKKLQLLDVRENSELDICHLEYTHHIPVAEIPQRFSELSLETPVVIYCKSGNRSRQACDFLKTKGYTLYNLAGGISAWAQTVDTQMKRY